MAKQPETVPREIEDLLAARRQLSEWLARLAEADGGVADRVRERVRADYEGRLAEVVFALRGHSTALTARMEELQGQLAEQERARHEEEETLAEASLRHQVGELSEAAWGERGQAGEARLDEVARRIQHLHGETQQLREVLHQIQPEPEPAPPPIVKPVSVVEASRTPEVAPPPASPVATSSEAETDEHVSLGEENIIDFRPPVPEVPAEPVEAPRFIPRGAGAQPARPKEPAGPAPKSPRIPTPPAPPAADELAFLKAMPVDAGKPGGSGTGNTRSGGREDRGAGQAKTLKCGDCGAMNRPTEWYCERCGGELAAL